MDESEGGRMPTATTSNQAATLCHDASRLEALLSIDWPAMLYLAFILHLMLVSFGLSTGVAAPLAVATSLLFSLTMTRLVSGTKLVIVDDGTVTFQGFRKKEIALADIEQITLPRWGELGPARVILEMRRAKPKRFWRLDLTTRAVALPGNVRFQAEVVHAILARGPDVSVDERALRLLAGKLPVLLRHRLPTLLAAGMGAAGLAALLIASFCQVFVTPWWYAVLALPVFAVPFTHCLERESPGKRAIASLGVSALAPLAMVSMATLLYGGQEYVPVLYACGLALAAGAFVAALPRSPSASALVVATATLFAMLVGATWHVTLADTIPVREVLLAPPPWSATFSPDGGTVVADGLPMEHRGNFAAVHFLDISTFETRTVALGESTGTVYWLEALGSSRALLRGDLGSRKGVWFVTAEGQAKRVEVPGGCGYLLPRAHSPDGRLLAMHQHYEIPTSQKPPRSLRRYVSRFLFLKTAVGETEVAPFELDADHRHARGLAWRANGRLVWGGVEQEEESDRGLRRGTFRMRSWAPGEDEPRVDFESRKKWSDTCLSPRCDKALTYVHQDGTRTCAVVSFADGRMTEVPGVEPHRALYPSAHWSEDASVYVFVPEAAPHTIRILRIATAEASTLCQAPFGEVTSTLVSPDGRRVAFTVEREHRKSIFIADTTSGEVRRLRPIGTFMLVLGDLAGSAAWSPDGKWLAIPAFGSRLALTASSGSGPLWLVSANDM